MLRIASRKSRLALAQVQEVARYWPNLKYEHIGADTYGDRHREISLWATEKSNLFTDEIDRLLLSGEADFAIHSAKDLPYPPAQGLEVMALTPPKSRTDSLVSRENKGLDSLPAGARVGTSSLARKNQVLAGRPDIEIVSIRGNIDERIGLIKTGQVDAVIVATCALERLGLPTDSANVLPFKTHPLQGHLAIVARSDRNDIRALTHKLDIRWKYGRMWLVGAGPGDPELLTRKAHRILLEADIIFYDALIEPGFLDGFPGEKVFVGKRKNHHSKTQDEINEMLYLSAIQGRMTVRLKGGDPLILSRAGEEMEYLRQRLVTVEVIPGISSVQASAASLQIPLTMRGVNRSVSIASAHEPTAPEDSEMTRIFLMGMTKRTELKDRLLQSGVPG